MIKIKNNERDQKHLGYLKLCLFCIFGYLPRPNGQAHRIHRNVWNIIHKIKENK